MLLVAAAFIRMLKAAFNSFVESSTNRMLHVAVLPQWNPALRSVLHSATVAIVARCSTGADWLGKIAQPAAPGLPGPAILFWQMRL